LDHQWLKIKGLELYWYGKEVRLGRKVGHLNFCSNDNSVLQNALQELNLPQPYPQAIAWIVENLPK
jgi:5-(carboxyamino)imidazole ribonucleotide synthase